MTTNRSDGWLLLAEPSRRRIVELLAEQPSSVAELAARMEISRPAVSQHLKVLRDAGMVRDEAHGTRRIHSVDPERLRRYRDELDAFWAGTLSALEGLVADPDPHPTAGPGPRRPGTSRPDSAPDQETPR
ncbi:metalloregulator ArsR/SmtB family transcription factor [Phycicoccus flavus]|uniref:metalloregulator ArsR/SmtB family transcription factor n=1 Tax=Phycicoccus flavus TaxID=2502783 RepID=UPI000FEBA083|nr:metalloregulator ArsR/SmtB family transcription factor [Phycicoccus flavus]NHA70151.1 metalloregulator ArsR/SmtB family transcription factor [Phycicoccus flavus]